MDVAQWLDNRIAARHSFGFRLRQPLIYPAHEISTGNVVHEQIQAVCRLVQAPVAKIKPGQGATAYQLGPITAATGFAIAATIELPIALKLVTGRSCIEVAGNLIGGCSSMRFHVTSRDS